MATRYKTARRKAIRNLRTAGWEGAKFTAKVAGKSAEGFFRWATTDHSGMTQALINMPEMGFIETIRYMLMVFVFTILYAIFAGISAYLTVVYWIPFLLGLLFS